MDGNGNPSVNMETVPQWFSLALEPFRTLREMATVLLGSGLLPADLTQRVPGGYDYDHGLWARRSADGSTGHHSLH